MYLRSIELDQTQKRDYKKYPFNISILNTGSFSMELESPLTIIVGENGSGKSTLLEAIALACGFNPSGGSRNNFYESISTESELQNHLNLIWNLKLNKGFFFRAETFYNFASEIDDLKRNPGGGNAYEPYGGKSLHQQSHGESFLSLFMNRLNQGIFIFDEPEAALSPQRQLSFLSVLDERLESKECQFIISTHSPILMSHPKANIFMITPQGLRKTTYKETEHYQITKDFLNSPETFHRALFKNT